MVPRPNAGDVMEPHLSLGEGWCCEYPLGSCSGTALHQAAPVVGTDSECGLRLQRVAEWHPHPFGGKTGSDLIFGGNWHYCWLLDRPCPARRCGSC